MLTGTRQAAPWTTWHTIVFEMSAKSQKNNSRRFRAANNQSNKELNINKLLRYFNLLEHSLCVSIKVNNISPIPSDLQGFADKKQ